MTQHLTRHRRARRAAAATSLLGAVLAAGCGFPAESMPRVIDPDEVSYDLLSPTTAPPTTLGTDIATAGAILYLVDAEEGVVKPVERKIAAPANLNTVLRALFEARPTPGEEEEGLTNVITPQTRLLEVTEDVSGSRIVIDLASYFPGLTFDEATFAIAQIVYTISERKGNDVDVAIFVEGQPEDVRTDDGKSVTQVSKSDLKAFEGTTTTSVAPEEPTTSPETTTAS